MVTVHYLVHMSSILYLPDVAPSGRQSPDQFNEWVVHCLELLLTFTLETILLAPGDDTVIPAHPYIAPADQSRIIRYFQPNMNNLLQFYPHFSLSLLM
jgi:hypothetical protein